VRSRLTILSVAFPFAPVSTDAVGGAEQVLASLDAALTRAGHRSIVLACVGSAVTGELVTIPEVRETIDTAARARVHAALREALAQVLASRRIDLIHFHGIDFAAYLPPPGPPALATLHLPPEWYPRAALRPTRAGTFLHAVSEAQNRALRALADPDAVLEPVRNGVNVAALGAVRHARRRFALMLGRLCPEKGQHIGLDAARCAGVKLLIAGAAFPYPAHQDYVQRDIIPRLDAGRLLGPVGFARKRRLLAAARCLLIPSLAPETSSLAAMEAAACGTPVIAFPAGALPEIVEDGVTGFLVSDTDAMARAIERARAIDPEACRRAARARFSDQAMASAYLRLYERLLPALVPP
jgi:glycosyltransferase involved in cell wall biosynthesis